MTMALFAGFWEMFDMPNWLFYSLIGVAVLLIVVFVAMRMMKKSDD